MWLFGDTGKENERDAKKAQEAYNEYQKALVDVLTVSARDYCDSAAKSLKEYSMISVQAGSSDFQENALLELYQKGKKIGAEKIVDVRIASRGQGFDPQVYLIGTALIPRKRQ